MDFLTISINLLGDRLNPELIDTELINARGSVRYRDAFGIKMTLGEAWLFDYGVLVCWNVTEVERQRLCFELGALMLAPADSVATEHYAYCIDPQSPLKIHSDKLTLPVDDPLCRLGLSHAFAQSSKLAFFEDRAQGEINRNRFLSHELAKYGKISLSRRQLAKLRGVLFATSSDISLHFNLLDTPEFFWDYPEQEFYYQALAKYLDLTPRIEILNHRLATIHEMLNMLASEQHHKHSAFLEWVIIVLIALEIMIYFLPKS